MHLIALLLLLAILLPFIITELYMLVVSLPYDREVEAALYVTRIKLYHGASSCIGDDR